jgi:hypothetical protein
MKINGRITDLIQSSKNQDSVFSVPPAYLSFVCSLLLLFVCSPLDSFLLQRFSWFILAQCLFPFGF